MQIAEARKEDLPEIVKLVNSAYRGEGSKQGWTSEADLIEGSLRTNLVNLEEILHKAGATLLKCTDAHGRINGSVYLQKEVDCLNLSMLSVNPKLQASGIGKKLLNAAVEKAGKEGLSKIRLSVISVRKELIAWYERHGYRFTGETKPMPADANFGRPRLPLHFIFMEKTLEPIAEKN